MTKKVIPIKYYTILYITPTLTLTLGATLSNQGVLKRAMHGTKEIVHGILKTKCVYYILYTICSILYIIYYILYTIYYILYNI